MAVSAGVSAIGPALSGGGGNIVRDAINRSSAGGTTTSADVTRDQWQNFLEFYRPIEEEVLKSAMQTDFTTEGDEAGQTAAAGVRTSRGSLARSLSRSGVALSAEERSAVNRRTESTLARSVGRAENTTRRGLSDSRTNLLGAIVGIGRGVAQTASSGLQSVADQAAQRQAQHDANRAATQQTNIGMGSTALGLALAFI